jgi:CheY-like chemotaxis protein
VLDSGTGFDPQRARELFDDFHTSSTESPFVEGVGIGLGITKRLVELMHGRIAFESQVDEGSVFSVSIPRAFPARGRFGAGQPRLLVADASSDARTMIEYVLESRMFIRSVPDVDAIELEVRRMFFDVILVDVSTAKPERLAEILEDVRDRYRETPAPIVAVDHKDVAHRADEMIELGFDYYMAKPFKKQTLITDISTLLFKSVFESAVTDEAAADDHIALRQTG